MIGNEEKIFTSNVPPPKFGRLGQMPAQSLFKTDLDYVLHYPYYCIVKKNKNKELYH